MCMRIGFLAQDLPHLQYAAKEAARKMSAPTQGAWQRLKRIARFLKGRQRCVQYFRRQDRPAFVTVKCDAGFAGCLSSRRSNSSVYLFHGSHLLRSSSTTQGLVALSSGESEFIAFVKACSVGLGAKAMCADLGASRKLQVGTDSSAGKGLASRRAVGRIRHLHTPLLWVQSQVQAEQVHVVKVAGNANAADLGTKHLSAADMERYLRECGFKFVRGTSTAALKAQW